MDIRTKINLVNESGTPFMGPGLLQLLQEIHRHKSINRAAKIMRLSYLKALKLLNGLEADLGQRIVIRKRGGSDRGGTSLTPLGRGYLREYARLEKRVKQRAHTEFTAFQSRIRKLLDSTDDC